ncbi:MAG: tetratricopeptide repeat protein [Bacteroidales bacterium]|nr:tetratricopeptide repeat protein [Bacteroidales bacterium]
MTHNKENLSVYEEMRQQANHLLDEGRIRETAALLTNLAVSLKTPYIQSMINKSMETYKYMMRFFLNGISDENREKVTSDIIESLRDAANYIVIESRVSNSPDLYSSTLRLNRLNDRKFTELIEEFKEIEDAYQLSLYSQSEGNYDEELNRRRDYALEDIFNRMLTSALRPEDIIEATKSVNEGGLPEVASKLIISGLTLSILQVYSYETLKALLDIYENNEENNPLATRALTGIVFGIYMHHDRVVKNEELLNRLRLWEDSVSTYVKLRETIRGIVGVRDTDRITNKMQEEVIPELMKLRPELLKRMREMNPESIQDAEFNPEWEEILSQSGLSKKMEELQEMQNDGADMMMVAFSSLKQFPFFNKAVNWFRSYESINSYFTLDGDLSQLLDLLTGIGNQICDSDKYSLALALRQMPEQQRNLVANNLNEQLDQLKEQLKDQEIRYSNPGFANELLKVLRDEYRFFRLFRNKSFLADPFSSPFDFRQLPVIGEMMADDDVLKLIGEFYFKRGYYKEALPVLEALAENEEATSGLWEKIGFARQSLGNFGAAREAYIRAELLKEPGPWLLKKLAIVNKRLGHFQDSAEYYARLLESEPENAGMLASYGHVLMELKQPDEALKVYYHANYLRPNDISILRAIAWAELLRKNFDKSIDIYNKILGQDPVDADYLNAGHAQAAAGNYAKAVDMYRKAASENDEEFRIAYMSDLSTLKDLGLSRPTALLLLDAVLLPSDDQ